MTGPVVKTDLGLVRGLASLTVIVWIYGSLWKFGSSSMPQYDEHAGRRARRGRDRQLR